MVCRVILSGFAVAYGVALFLFLTGTFGWFGQEKDPLSGVFLLPLGLPWNLAALPDRFMPFRGAAGPAVNLAVIWLFCRHRSKRHTPPGSG